MLKVKCPKCKHDMLYDPRPGQAYTHLKKRCVYCGCTFKVHSDMRRSRIIESL